jgi:hypothetical protein
VRRGCLPRLHEESGDKMGTVGIRHFFQEKVDYLRKFDIFQLLNAEVILKSSTIYLPPPFLLHQPNGDYYLIHQVIIHSTPINVQVDGSVFENTINYDPSSNEILF